MLHLKDPPKLLDILKSTYSTLTPLFSNSSPNTFTMEMQLQIEP